VELDKLGVTYKVLGYRWWMETYQANFITAAVKFAIRPLRLITSYIIFSLLLLLKRNWFLQFDLICTNTIVIPVGIVMKILFRKRHVWFIHEYGYEDQRLKFVLPERLSFLLMERYTDVFLANSSALLNYYEKIFRRRKVMLLYYGVDTGLFPNSPQVGTPERTKFTCVIVGRLFEGKGQSDAILAVGELKKKGVDIDLWIVGDGDGEYKRRLCELVARNNLRENVRFLGFVLPPTEAIRRADVALMCSRNEAFGRVTIEYMKFGKPVIASSSGANPELIKEGFNGFLYGHGDFKGLADRIKCLMDKPGEIVRMGDNARRWASETFTLDKYTENFLRIIKEILIMSS